MKNAALFAIADVVASFANSSSAARATASSFSRKNLTVRASKSSRARLPRLRAHAPASSSSARAALSCTASGLCCAAAGFAGGASPRRGRFDAGGTSDVAAPASNAANAFDQLSSTHFESLAAGYVQAGMSRAWRITGYALSVYGLSRLGSALSVLDFAQMGSSVSLRSFFRGGSALSVYGLSRLGSALSALDFVQIGCVFTFPSSHTSVIA